MNRIIIVRTMGPPYCNPDEHDNDIVFHNYKFRQCISQSYKQFFMVSECDIHMIVCVLHFVLVSVVVPLVFACAAFTCCLRCIVHVFVYFRLTYS